MTIILMLWASLFAQQLPPKPSLGAPPATAGKPLEKSAYFAFVDREYIFTLEVVRPGVPIVNFICMGDTMRTLYAKEIRVALETRKIPGTIFAVDTGDPKQPLKTPLMQIKRRSSFGVTLDGEFGDAREFYGVTIRLGNDDFKLAPLSSFEFENLALKVNKLNLGSPDFSDDWRVLQLDLLGSRAPVRGRRIDD